MSAFPQAVFERQDDAVFAGRMEAIAVAGELFVTERDGSVRLEWTRGHERGLARV